MQAEIRDGHTALIALNRPTARNAVNADMANAIEALVDATEIDPQIRAVVLCSSHPAVFSAGADLKEVSAGRGDKLATERGGLYRLPGAAFQLSESEMRELTREARAVIVASNDYKEGPLAFIEQRAPRWSGT